MPASQSDMNRHRQSTVKYCQCCLWEEIGWEEVRIITKISKLTHAPDSEYVRPVHRFEIWAEAITDEGIVSIQKRKWKK